MRKTVFLDILLLVFVVVSPGLASAADKVDWVTLDEGLKKAKAAGKPMIVDFFYDLSCPRCAMLERNIYGEPKIARKINADFVAVRIDLTKELSAGEKELGEKFDFKNDCLLLFLDPQGNVYKDPKGKKLCFVEDIEPELFIAYLDMVKEKIAAGQKP
ncbi:MAG: hypothetical protein OHK006_22320 [Thermodesulfovibrionales bacterium]